MKKWVLILIIILIVIAAFAVFALTSDLGSEVLEKTVDSFSGNSIPNPPALPD